MSPIEATAIVSRRPITSPARAPISVVCAPGAELPERIHVGSWRPIPYGRGGDVGCAVAGLLGGAPAPPPARTGEGAGAPLRTSTRRLNPSGSRAMKNNLPSGDGAG